LNKYSKAEGMFTIGGSTEKNKIESKVCGKIVSILLLGYA